MASPPIPHLPGSPTHTLAIEVYQRHHDAGTGICASCGAPAPCPPSRHAAAILTAAGDDLAAYQPASWAEQEARREAAAPPKRQSRQRQGLPRSGQQRTNQRDVPAPRSGPPPEPEPDRADVVTDVDGFYVSGRRRAMNPAGFGYERDQD